MPLFLPRVIVWNYGNDSKWTAISTKKTEYKNVNNAFTSFMSVGAKIIHNDFTMKRNEERCPDHPQSICGSDVIVT